MAVTNSQSGTNVEEIAAGIYRISTPSTAIPGGFTFNQYLIVDDEPLLFHTGHHRSFDLVREAVASVLPVERLRHIALSHFEADECGSLNQWLAVAPDAAPLCGRLAAMTSIRDFADRPPRELANDEDLALGAHTVRWFDMPHMPHAWECGMLMDRTSGTLFCSDLFTQAGATPAALTESDILGPSEALRSKLDYFSHARNSRELLERLAAANPAVLACMHGSAFRGDCAKLLRELANIILA
ncbi:MAG TPA: MBL fold metallo-hydrolase [Candidatus Binataceae bacterium]|nr:MBL fold metallo-hydrolase [Candidatus Binataceae bacterium]